MLMCCKTPISQSTSKGKERRPQAVCTHPSSPQLWRTDECLPVGFRIFSKPYVLTETHGFEEGKLVMLLPENFVHGQAKNSSPARVLSAQWRRGDLLGSPPTPGGLSALSLWRPVWAHPPCLIHLSGLFQVSWAWAINDSLCFAHPALFFYSLFKFSRHVKVNSLFFAVRNEKPTTPNNPSYLYPCVNQKG